MSGSPIISSPMKRKKSEKKDEAPRTPVLDDHLRVPFTPCSLLNFPMTPFYSPSTTKIPTSHDWSSLGQHLTGSALSVSEHVFTQDPLSPLLSQARDGGQTTLRLPHIFSTTNHTDELSPLIDFGATPQVPENVDQHVSSLPHKTHLSNRNNRSTSSAPFNLSAISPHHPRLTLDRTRTPAFSQSLLDTHQALLLPQRTRVQLTQSSTVYEDESFEDEGLMLSVPQGALLSNAKSAFSSSGLKRSAPMTAPLSPMPGVDAIIFAAESDFDVPVKKESPSSSATQRATHRAIDAQTLLKPSTPPSSSTPVHLSSANIKAESLKQLEIRAELLRQDDKTVHCNCKKSRCLKMYCDCFRLTEYCKVGCHCIDCNNLEQYESARQSSIKSIVDRNPEAFKPRVLADPKSQSKGHLTGCHCRKSQCLKKYCECFTERVACTPRCRCVDCKNGADLYANSDRAKTSATAQLTQVPPFSSPPYKAMSNAQLNALSQRERERPRERERVRDTSPLTTHTQQSATQSTFTTESTPERESVGGESLLSPQMLAVRLNTHSGRENAVQSPSQIEKNAFAVASPLRLLELASVCEERQEQESASHSRSGSITSH